MEVIKTIKELRERLRDERSVGCVPTMGNIHDGHLSLVKIARANAALTVTTIFVNRLQFGQGEDFDKYPRTFEEDCEKLEAAGNDIVFAPDEKEMYPEPQTFYVELPKSANKLEGRFRPGHFRGMATVVLKLFNIVQPQVAVFGEKDFQQFMVIRRMTQDLCIPVEVVGAATVRTPDGLAMSSRNRYLTPEERQRAPRIHQALVAAVRRLDAGDRDYADIEREGAESLVQAGMKPDYFAVRDAQTLDPPTPESRELVVLTAARLGRARLIDNLRAHLS